MEVFFYALPAQLYLEIITEKEFVGFVNSSEVLLSGHQRLQGGTRASPVEILMDFYPPCPSGIVREAQYLPSLPALLPAKQN